MEDIKPNLRRKAPAKGTASLDSSSSTASDAFVPVSDEDEDIKPAKRRRANAANKNQRTPATSEGPKSSKPRSRPWTAEEYLAVLDGVTKHGAGPKAFADIPGRTSHQAASAWR
jgi:hypothetical protein